MTLGTRYISSPTVYWRYFPLLSPDETCTIIEVVHRGRYFDFGRLLRKAGRYQDFTVHRYSREEGLVDVDNFKDVEWSEAEVYKVKYAIWWRGGIKRGSMHTSAQRVEKVLMYWL